VLEKVAIMNLGANFLQLAIMQCYFSLAAEERDFSVVKTIEEK
jgi:hypothetical protein